MNSLIALAVVLVGCGMQASGYPFYYPYYSSNMDSLSYGSDSNQGALVYSRFYQPYYSPSAMNAGLATFMYQPQPQVQNSPYYTHRRPTTGNLQKPLQNDFNPQQNEVIPLEPEVSTTLKTDLTDSTERDLTTTLKPVIPELDEPEIDELDAQPRKRVSKKKPVAKEEDDDEEFVPKMPQGVMFPMFFGYGRSAGGPPGVTAVANAYSTGRGGVASSHATAYGPPRPDMN